MSSEIGRRSFFTGIAALVATAAVFKTIEVATAVTVSAGNLDKWFKKVYADNLRQPLNIDARAKS